MSSIDQKILHKLNHIESLQKKLLQNWHQMEDFLAETASPNLKNQIRQARKNYKQGKYISYQKLRKKLGLD